MSARFASLAGRAGLTVGVAAAVVAVSYHSGSYGEFSRDTIAIVAWWLAAVGVAVGVLPFARLTIPVMIAFALLAAFAAWTFVSAAWAANGNDTLIEFNRVLLYAAVLALVALASSRATAPAWCDGLALGLVAVVVVALHSRFFPSAAAVREARTLLPSSFTRLSYPLGYWNGLGIVVALALPLLLRAAVAAYPAAIRGLALAPVPGIAAVIYLTSSRGAVATAAVGTVAFVLLARRRAETVVALALAGIAALVAVELLRRRHVLVNGPLASHTARSEGRAYTWILIGICVALFAAYALASWVLRRFPAPRLLDVALAPVVVIAVVAVVIAAHPIRRFDEFKQLPGQRKVSNPIEAHLLAGSGSGRWQQWAAAVAQWRTHRIKGDAAGSYEAWWLQHGTTPAFVKNAHNLYAEVLGELGIIGLALLAGAFACGIVAGAVRVWRSENGHAVAPACLAAFLAYDVGAGVDWMWELSAVSIVGIALLGLLTGPATQAADAVAPGPAPRWSPWRLAALAAGVVLAAVHVVPLAAGLKLRDSEQAAARGQLARAADDALAARNINPWAPASYEQIGLLAERADQLVRARAWIDAAIRRDSRNWRLWLIRSRLQTKSGDIGPARASLHRAAALNPRSPLFASVK